LDQMPIGKIIWASYKRSNNLDIIYLNHDNFLNYAQLEKTDSLFVTKFTKQINTPYHIEDSPFVCGKFLVQFAIKRKSRIRNDTNQPILLVTKLKKRSNFEWIEFVAPFRYSMVKK
jgi:hypothetical protein